MEKHGESQNKFGNRVLSEWIWLVKESKKNPSLKSRYQGECMNNTASTHNQSNLQSFQKFSFLGLIRTTLSKILVFPITIITEII